MAGQLFFRRLKQASHGSTHLIVHEPASGPWYYKVRAINSRAEASTDVEAGPFTLPALPEVELGPGSVHAENMAAGAVDLASAVVTGQLLAANLADNAVTQAKLAEGMIPTRVINALPSIPDVDYPEGSTVFLTTDGKLYKVRRFT